MTRYVLIGCLLTMLTGCTSTRTKGAYTLPLTQLAKPSYLATTEFQQQLTTKIKNHSYTFIVAGKITSQAIILAAYSPAGMPLFTLDYNQDNIDIQQHIAMPIELPPQAILQDLQLTYWPIDVLQTLIKPPWRIQADNNHRILYLNGKAWSTITYDGANAWQDDITLINHVADYQLMIKTLLHHKQP